MFNRVPITITRDPTALVSGISTSADLVPAIPGKQIGVAGILLSSPDRDVSAKLQSGGSTDLTGAMELPLEISPSDEVLCETAPGEKLNVVLSCAADCGGMLFYRVVSPGRF